MSAGVEIVSFNERFAADFASLNYEWIEKYFGAEDHDREMLDHPQTYIIDRGGEIFFALIEDKAVGTVAMIDAGNGKFELAKMAVSPAHQGKGIANLLIERCIEFAKERNAAEIFLESNSKLAPAITLYRKYGFVDAVLEKKSEYQRCNVEMRLAI